MIAYHELDQLDSTSYYDFVVVDEAHHAVMWAQGDDERLTKRFGILEAITKTTESLLMLSATPVLGNELGFFTIASSGGPNLYDASDFHRFQERIDKRQEIMGAFFGCMRTKTTLLLRNASRVREYFPADTRLERLEKRFLEQKEILTTVARTFRAFNPTLVRPTACTVGSFETGVTLKF